MWYVCVCNGILFHFKRVSNLVTFEHMGESGDHHAKLNNLNTGKQIFCDLTYMWNLKKKQTHTNKVKKGLWEMGRC